MKYEKESEEVIIESYKKIIKDINTVKKYEYHIRTKGNNSFILSGKDSIFFTCMYDGKSLTAITKYLLDKETLATKDCHACGLKQSEFIESNKQKDCDIPKSVLDLGLCTLHTLLRSMEYVFNLGVRGSTGNVSMKSEAFLDAKASKKIDFESELCLKLFQVKIGGGTSNDGNLCRKFFKNAEKTADILELPLEIIQAFEDLNNIISNCKNIPDQKSFETISNFLLHMLTTVEPFNKSPLTPTVHRLLVHGYQYIKHFYVQYPIPHGALSESALESRNKFNHRFREHLSYKGSLVQNLRDLGVRHLLASDPYISLMLRKDKKRK